MNTIDLVQMLYAVIVHVYYATVSLNACSLCLHQIFEHRFF